MLYKELATYYITFIGWYDYDGFVTETLLSVSIVDATVPKANKEDNRYFENRYGNL